MVLAGGLEVVIAVVFAGVAGGRVDVTVAPAVEIGVATIVGAEVGAGVAVESLQAVINRLNHSPRLNRLRRR